MHTAAHEAAHVVQQRGGVQLKSGVSQSGDVYEQHADAVADLVVRGQSAQPLLDSFASGSRSSDDVVQKRENPRFDENPEIDRAEASSDYIRRGDTGMTVRIIQQGLIDAGYALPSGVTGVFDTGTEQAVKQFQRDNGIADDGLIGPDTMGKLNNTHNRRESVVAIAQGHDRANPLADTRSLNASEIAAFNAAIVTEPRTATGALPTFEADNTHGNYEARIRARMLEIITNMHADYQDQAHRRAQPDSLHEWSSIEAVAAQSKAEADRVFGSYAQGPAFVRGTNLKDAWEEETKAINHDPGYDTYILNDLASYLLNNYMTQINEQHGAVASRATEQAILERVKNDFIASHRRELLDIQIAWPGLADEGVVSLQRLRAADDPGNRGLHVGAICDDHSRIYSHPRAW